MKNDFSIIFEIAEDVVVEIYDVIKNLVDELYEEFLKCIDNDIL